MEPKRHFDNGRLLLSFADEIWVVCPNCHLPGIVSGDAGYSEWHGKFSCTHCSLILDTKKGGWHGPVILYGRRPCCHCGHKWVGVRLRYPKYDKSVPVDQDGICPACNKVLSVACEWRTDRHADNAIDPFFGLPLYLRSDCKQGEIWAFNLNHIKNYRDFISADLRERQGTPKWSWITRLPSWIKSAKNRKHVLKALDRMELLYNKANAANAKSRAAD